MISYKITDVRSFMNLLLRGQAFDPWEVREVKLNTLIKYTIDGGINQAFLSEAEKESLEHSYILWQDLKETMFTLIRGKKQPTLMHIILAFPKDQITDVPTGDVESFLLNVHYENGALSLITATSMRNFTMDKTAEQYWDGFLQGFMKRQGIEMETL